MSYRKPINLMFLYTIPFTAVLLSLIIGLSFWIIKKHDEEQIAEFLATSRSLADNLIFNNIAIGKTENRDGIVFSIRELKDRGNTQSDIANEYYTIKKTETGRVFHYEKRLPARENNRFSIITVEIPMTLSDLMHSKRLKRDIISFLAIGLLSIAFISFTFWRLSKRISNNIYREIQEDRLRALIELAGATAHEMRQPLSIIIGFTEIIKDKLRNGEDIEGDFRIIKEQCLRMDDIIKKMLNITHYKTLEYTDGVRILDIHSQGQNCLN